MSAEPPPSTAPTTSGEEILDPVAKARALAAKFSQKYGGPVATTPTSSPATGANDSVLGKRTRDESALDEVPLPSSLTGGEEPSETGGSKRKKILVPVAQFPDVNFAQVLFGPRGETLRELESSTNTRIYLRGQGSVKDAPINPDDEPMYVLIQAESEESMEAAAVKVTELIQNPHAAPQASKEQQPQSQQQLTTADHFVSPLHKEGGNPNTFALSSALYANDDGFTMMQSRVSMEQLREERLAMRDQARPGETSKDIQVDSDKVGLVIGKAGETCRQIQALTGCYVQVHKEVPGEPRGPTRTVTLKGTEAAIAAGEIEIHRVCSGGRVGIDSMGGPSGGGGARPGLGYGASNEEVVQVPAAMVGLVIGKGGENIKQIQIRSGALLQVQKEESVSGLRDIKILGSPAAIAAARVAIDDICQANAQGGGMGGPPRGGFGGDRYGGGPPGIPGVDGVVGGGGAWRPGQGGGGFRGAPLSGPGMLAITVQVPNALISSIIGKGGEVVKSLQKVSGARIQIAADLGHPMRDVIVSGRPEQTDIAKREIEQIIHVKSTSGGMVHPNSIGGGGYGGPPDRYGGPPSHGGYGGPHGGYGGPPQGGYGGPPPHHQQGPPPQHGGYGGPPQHGGYPPQGPPAHQQGGYGGPQQGGYPPQQHGGYDPYGAPPAHHQPHQPPPMDDAPIAPTDPNQFQTWWTTLSLPQQQAYYRKHHPEMLSQLGQ